MYFDLCFEIVCNQCGLVDCTTFNFSYNNRKTLASTIKPAKFVSCIRKVMEITPKCDSSSSDVE